MKIPASLSLNSHAPNLADQIASVPVSAGVYLLASAGKTSEHGHVHLGRSANLNRRLSRLLVSGLKDSGGPLGRIREGLARIECWETGSRLENSLLMYELARTYFPDEYVKRLRLRMPWFVGLTAGDPFPRVSLGNRIPRKHAALFGPFPNRDSAQCYEAEVAGLFQLRRCVERLAPDPGHPGCIYGEMNQCLRPCQCAVTSEEYSSEVSRVANFLATNGRSTVAVLSAARERACEETDFEAAAYIHKRIEKANAAAAARDEVIADLDQFNGVALTRGVENRQVRLWPMIQGFWQEALTFDFATEEAATKSLDNDLRQRIEEALVGANTNRNRLEDLAIFSRWYFSSFRDGQWFAFRGPGDLNYRRLVREISKLAKPSPGHSKSGGSC